VIDNNMTVEIGASLKVPTEYTLEIKELHDAILRRRDKAKHSQTYNLWMRLNVLLPETKTGTWSIRHGLTTVYVVKISQMDAE
jgi:subtilisin-like proprotein convertase family protein